MPDACFWQACDFLYARPFAADPIEQAHADDRRRLPNVNASINLAKAKNEPCGQGGTSFQIPSFPAQITP
jgi:hypothetical protein